MEIEIGTTVIETEGFFKGLKFVVTGEYLGTNPNYGERRLLAPEVPKAPKLTPQERAEKKLSHLQSSPIDSRLLAYLKQHREQVRIRVFYPPTVEVAAVQTLSRLGVILPEDIRPIDSGARGSELVQYRMSGEVRFPLPTDLSLLPEGSKTTDRDDNVYVPRLSFALGLLQNGFTLTDYTRGLA